MDNNSREVGPGNQETEDKKPLNILLVEDDKSIVPLIERVFNGHKITVFDNAEQALEELRKNQKLGVFFDWIITDKGLKGKMDGFDLAKAVKEDRLGNPFVTLLTGSAVQVQDQNTAQQLREKGIHQLMGKPFDIKQLKNSVNDAREFNKQSQVPQASKI